MGGIDAWQSYAFHAAKLSLSMMVIYQQQVNPIKTITNGHQ